MSEIVITGATGVIGRRVRQLAAAGHSVLGVTRSARGRAVVEGLGARAVEADVFDPGALAAVARAAQAAGVARLVQESVAFLYADGAEDWLAEDAPVHATGPTETALVAEENAMHLFPGETVVLRFGLFVGSDSHLTRSDIEAARAGISPTLGPRSAYRPTVWLDDAAAAVTSVIAAPPGVYNVADTDPPTRAEIDAALAAAVGRHALRPALDRVPRDVEPIARSQRVSSSRLREATGWAPAVRGRTDGWSLILGQEIAA